MHECDRQTDGHTEGQQPTACTALTYSVARQTILTVVSKDFESFLLTVLVVISFFLIKGKCESDVVSNRSFK